jgi:transposase-like protein
MERARTRCYGELFVDSDKTVSYSMIDLPASLASRVRTTNLLERFQEMRRKQRDIEMFQSEQGCEALWYLLASRETAKQRVRLQSRL